jgi:hypothetical protein
MWLRWGKQGTHRGFWRKNLFEDIHLKDQDGDGRITLWWILGRLVVRMGEGKK